MAHPIIVNASHLSARPTGIGVYALELIRAWAARPNGFEFSVYVHETAMPLLEDISSPQISLHTVSERWFPANANFLRFLYSNLLSASKRKAILFHVSQFEAAYVGPRQVLTVHDLIPLEEATTRMQRLFLRYVLPRCLEQASMVIAPSQTTADALQSRYRTPAAKIRIIPHGVRRLPVQPDLAKSSRPYILFAGRLTPYRNLDRLAAAFLSIQDRIEHDLVLAGEPAPGFSPPPHHPRIRMTGYVDDATLAGLYRNAALFVFPSQSEGFGFPPLEAMLCGTPVVTSKESSLAEVCADAAWFIDPRNAESIADGLLRVLLDEQLREKLREAGLQRAGELTWRTSAERHLQVFEEVEMRKAT